MKSCFHGSTLNQGSNVISILVNALDKGGTGPKTAQTEALSAACLLLCLANSGACPDQHVNTLWNVVFDMDKQYFVSEKFLAAATDSSNYIIT